MSSTRGPHADDKPITLVLRPEVKGLRKTFCELKAVLMECLWDWGQTIVSEVYRELATRRALAYTTVKTIVVLLSRTAADDGMFCAFAAEITMLRTLRRFWWCLVVLGTGVVFLTQSMATVVSGPHPPQFAGLCQPRCAPASPHALAPVALPTLALSLPLFQSYLGVVHEGDRHVLSLVARSVSLTRAPPRTIAHLASYA